MQKKIENIIKFLLVLTFFVPLVTGIKSFIFPFIVPKILLFRILVLLMTGLYLLLLSIDWKAYRPRLNSINIAVSLFYLSFVISTFVGVDWYKSFWDNHERMLGLFTITHYLLYYFIISAVFKEWNDWKWFFRLFLGIGSIVMFIGVLQRFVNQDLYMNKGNRVFGTLGNAIYFSGYGLFLFFIGLFLALKETIRLRSFWFWYAAIGSFLGFCGIFLGGTRGAFLGLLAGLGIFALIYIFFIKNHRKLKLKLGVLILIAVALTGILFAYRKSSFVISIPAVGRLLNTSISSSNTRIMAWGIAVDAWKEKPVFGWGPNNYFYAFNKYYRAEFLEHGWGETWFDSAHSVVMNTLAVQGLVGIIFYLALFFVPAYILIKNYRKDKVTIHDLAIGISFLFAHLVSLVTVFENPTSYLYFFFFLAFVASLNFNNSAVNDGTKRKELSWGVVGLVGLVVVIFIYTTDINPVKANMYTLDAIKSVQGMDYGGKTPVDLYNEAVSYPSPHIDDIRNDFARISSQSLSRISDENLKKELFELLYSELEKNINLHPLDIRTHIQKAGLGVSWTITTGDNKYFIEAEKYLEDALEKSPKRQQVVYQLAGIKLNLGKFDGAAELLRQSVEDDYKIDEGWTRLVAVYMAQGDSQKAVEIVNEALEKGVVFKGDNQSVINQVLGSVELK